MSSGTTGESRGSHTEFSLENRKVRNWENKVARSDRNIRKPVYFRFSAHFAVLSPHLVVASAPAEVLPSRTPRETL